MSIDSKPPPKKTGALLKKERCEIMITCIPGSCLKDGKRKMAIIVTSGMAILKNLFQTIALYLDTVCMT